MLAQGGKPILAQAYLGYVQHRIGEASARIGARNAMQAVYGEVPAVARFVALDAGRHYTSPAEAAESRC